MKYTLLLLGKTNKQKNQTLHQRKMQFTTEKQLPSTLENRESQEQRKHLIEVLRINSSNRQRPQVLNGQTGKALETERKSRQSTGMERTHRNRQHRHKTQQGKHIQNNGLLVVIFSWNNQTHLKKLPINLKSTKTAAWISQRKDLLR